MPPTPTAFARYLAAYHRACALADARQYEAAEQAFAEAAGWEREAARD